MKKNVYFSYILLYAAKYAGLFVLSSWITKRWVRVLAYHGIWFLPGHFGNFLFMSPEKFESRMAWLKNSKYSVIPLDRAIEDLKNRRTEPYSIVITIDDGWYGTYRFMLPCLEKTSFPATLYVYTGYVDLQAALPNILLQAVVHLTDKTILRITAPTCDTAEELSLQGREARDKAATRLLEIMRELGGANVSEFCRVVSEELGFDYDNLIRSRQFHLMRYDEISDAERRGLDIQLHSHTHKLSKTDPGKICEEIKTNREKLAPHVRSSLDHFCYPSGVHCEEMYSYLADSNIKSATLVEPGFVTPETELFAIKRILDGEDIEQIEFEAEISGFLELMRQAKSIIRG